MATVLQRLGIDKLGVEERLALIDELWESIAREHARPPVPAHTHQEKQPDEVES